MATDAPTPESTVKIRITENRTVIGNFEYALGSVIDVTQAQADALVKNKKAEIVGV